MITTTCTVSFLSTLSLRRATLSQSSEKSTPEISIHALLAESDRQVAQTCRVKLVFLSTLSLRRATGKINTRGSVKTISIHALLAESDDTSSIDDLEPSNFYPRSPCGERPRERASIKPIFDFYPRSPCGERRVHYDNYNLHCVISIHALLAESDDKTNKLAG